MEISGGVNVAPGITMQVCSHVLPLYILLLLLLLLLFNHLSISVFHIFCSSAMENVVLATNECWLKPVEWNSVGKKVLGRVGLIGHV